MIEAHLEKSSCRAKAREFGVAAGKGSGAEERRETRVDSGGTEKIRPAVAAMRRAILSSRFQSTGSKKVAVITAILFFRQDRCGQSSAFRGVALLFLRKKPLRCVSFQTQERTLKS